MVLTDYRACLKKTFIYVQEEIKKVRNNTLVSFDGNYYSAPEEYKGEKIIVRYSDRTVRLVSLDGKFVLAKYTWCYGKNQKKYRIWNILYKLQHKSNGFDQSRERRDMRKWLRVIYEKTFASKADEFFAYLELIQNSKRDSTKRFLKWHETYGMTLTIDSMLAFITGC